MTVTTQKRVGSIDFSLDEFENWIRELDYDRAETGLRAILDHVRQGYPLQGGRMGANGEREIARLKPFDARAPYAELSACYARLALAITTLLSSRNFMPSTQALLVLLLNKNHLQEIFVCGGYRNMDHILVNLDLYQPDGQLKLTASREDLIRLLMCYTLESAIDVNLELFFRFDATLAFWAYMGLLTNCNRATSRRAEEIRTRLHELGGVFEQLDLDEYAIQGVSNPWMLTTYLDLPGRHVLKRHMNNGIVRWWSQTLPESTKQKLREMPAVGWSARGKPTMVVCAEVLRSNHAMFRSFSGFFEAFRKRFRLLLLVGKDAYDDISAAAFDRVKVVSENVCDLPHTVETILGLEPDVIWYPSLGMASWTVALCNLRLARTQMMGAGHPATSMSAQIDYMLLGDFVGQAEDYQRFCIEKVVLLRDAIERHNAETQSQREMTFERHRPDDGIVRLAVSSSLVKISPRFIETCRTIADNCSQQIEFHFFIAERGIKVDAFRVSLSEVLPNSVVYRESAYPTYVHNLSKCDLALGTFPFGGSNTNVDLALLGIPKVIMDDDASDLAGKSDLSFWSVLAVEGLPVANSELAYAAKAVYLIHDHGAREELSSRILDANPRAKIFGRRPLAEGAPSAGEILEQIIG